MEAFYGEVLKAGSELKPKIEAGNVLRVTQVSLPVDAKGRITVYAVVDGKTLAIGTLDPQAKLYQLAIDLIFCGLQSVAFTAKGVGAVHVCGYVQPTGDDAFGEDEGPQGEDEDSDEFAEDDVSMEGAMSGLSGDDEAALGAAPAEEDDEEDDEEMEMDSDDLAAMEAMEDEEEDEDDEEMEMDSDDLAALEAMEDEDDEDDEEEELPPPPPKKQRMEGRGRGAGRR